ncbi:hypothetical protein GOP47_0015339 [Adiantum capillus-veneris]|uniref:F-box domain-containing protein n=1 Tax=Adiantum capillus-veneris TaxID=13818 RepID=A0A9D4ZB62_ADICA|nr:hypothetical protein GOP47_0015339 [Adiantum capillus-veneris]
MGERGSGVDTKAKEGKSRVIKERRSAKRNRVSYSQEAPDIDHEREEGLQLEKGLSSYGVQPLGNLFLSSFTHNIRDCGLGSLFLLSDEILCEILGFLKEIDLVTLSLVSKSFYVFSHQDFLWRNLVLDKFGGDFRFKIDWRCSYAAAISPLSPPPLPVLEVSMVF